MNKRVAVFRTMWGSGMILTTLCFAVALNTTSDMTVRLITGFALLGMIIIGGMHYVEGKGNNRGF